MRDWQRWLVGEWAPAAPQTVPPNKGASLVQGEPGITGRTRIVLAGLAYVSFIGLSGLVLARGMNLDLFYLLGCALVGWGAGTRSALLVVVAAAVFLFLEEPARRSDLPGWMLFWNQVMRLMGFSAAGWLAAEVGRLTRRLEWTVQERTRRLEEEMEQHKETAARWRETSELFRQVTENITEVFWVTDPAKTRVNYISGGFERVWGRPRQELYASPGTWLEAVHAEDRERVACAIVTRQISGEYDEEYRVIRPDSTTRLVHDRAFPVRNENGEVYRLVGIAEDITDRRQAEQLILEISDREQARLGQDIHDGLCQQLIGLALGANSLARDLAAEDVQPEAATAKRLCALLDEAITEARRVCRGLYPVRLDTDGLVPALEELARLTAERFSMACRCQSQVRRLEFDLTTATHLYRIAQEAVNNAVKHSQGRAIVIQLAEKDEIIELRVSDDGQGLKHLPTRQGGMGLHIMDYRARSIGGTLRVAGGSIGTIVTCRVPRGTKAAPRSAASNVMREPLIV